MFQAGAVVFSEVAHFATYAKAAADLSHYGDRSSGRGFLLGHPNPEKMGPFRLVGQIKGRYDTVRDQFSIKRQYQLGAIFPGRRCRYVIEAVRAALHCECQTKWRRLPVE